MKMKYKFIIILLTSIQLQARETSLISGDIGASTGNNNGTTFQEYNLGVNVNFTDWLTWRNSGFQRQSSNRDPITGLDSTLRLVLRTKIGQTGSFNLFAGPGYRWTSGSENNAQVGEAGLGLTFDGIGASAGAKYLKYDEKRFSSSGRELKQEEVTYFFNITGRTSFGK